MAQTWPPDLPFFTRADDHSRTGPQDAVIRTQMSAGPAKVRRRSTAAPRGYNGSIPVLTRFEFDLFEEWFEQTIASGALAFDVTDPLDGIIKTFRFVGGYTASPIGTKLRVSAELEIVEQPARATVSIPARILGDPTQAFPGDTLYASPAVYAGQSGAIEHRWYRDGSIVGTGLSYAVKQRDLFSELRYQTRAINGASSTTDPVTINAMPPQDVIVVGTQRVIAGRSFVVPSTAFATVMSGSDTVMSGPDTVVAPL